MYRFRQHGDDPKWSEDTYGLAPSQRYPRGTAIQDAAILDCERPAWRITKETQLLTSGSCFAYHIANALRTASLPARLPRLKIALTTSLRTKASSSSSARIRVSVVK